MYAEGKMIKLPTPAYDGKLALEAAFLRRRSIRNYKEDPVDLKEISQLLWAAQGIIRPAATGPAHRPEHSILWNFGW